MLTGQQTDAQSIEWLAEGVGSLEAVEAQERGIYAL